MELMVRTRVGEKGRILIPAAIRERLGVMIGDPVVLELEDDVLRIRSLEARLARTRARLRQFATPGKLMSASLIAERREEASRE